VHLTAIDNKHIKR